MMTSPTGLYASTDLTVAHPMSNGHVEAGVCRIHEGTLGEIKDGMHHTVDSTKLLAVLQPPIQHVVPACPPTNHKSNIDGIRQLSEPDRAVSNSHNQHSADEQLPIVDLSGLCVGDAGHCNSEQGNFHDSPGQATEPIEPTVLGLSSQVPPELIARLSRAGISWGGRPPIGIEKFDSFTREATREDDPWWIDGTHIIPDFLRAKHGDSILLLRPRRCGKTILLLTIQFVHQE
jgi:hypothetical protein